VIRKVIRSSILFTLGNMMPLLASVVLLVPYTDNLSTSLYGELAIYISFTLLLQVIFNYGLDNYTGIHHFDYKNDTYKLRQFVGTIVAYLFMIGSIVTLSATIAGYILFPILLGDAFVFFPYGFMCVITAFCNSFFRTYVNFLFYDDKAKKYFWLNFFNFIITIALCWIGLEMYKQTLIGPMWGRLLSGIAIFLVACILYIREYGISWAPETIPGLQRFCVPVVLFFLLNWVTLYINNYIINAYSGTTDVGVYDFALKCTLLIEFVQTGILGTINPRIYALWKNKGEAQSTVEENRYHHVFSMFTVLFVAINIVLLPIAIQLFVNNESYYEVFRFLPVLCAAFVFRGIYNAYYNVVIYHKKTQALPRALAVTSLIQITLCIVLLQAFGIWGAVWSFVLAKPVQIFFLWIESRKLFTFRYNFIKIFALPLLYFTIVLLLQYLPLRLTPEQLAVIQLLLAILIVLLVFRKDMKDVKYVVGR